MYFPRSVRIKPSHVRRHSREIVLFIFNSEKLVLAFVTFTKAMQYNIQKV